MEITLNNRKEQIESKAISLAELIEYKNFSFKLLVTKVNGRLIKKDERDDVMISPGDDVQILHMISGG